MCKLQKVQVAFIRGTNSKIWNDACETFLLFATAEQLEPFKKLNFNGKTLPPTFMKFCQQATTLLLLLKIPQLQRSREG